MKTGRAKGASDGCLSFLSTLWIKIEVQYHPMPHIRFRSLQSPDVRQLSVELGPVLASAIQTSEDNFTFELIQTQFFTQGQETPSYPFVEVLWFARSQEVQDRCALLITEKVKTLSKADDVVVVFTVLEKTAYYENGKHF